MKVEKAIKTGAIVVMTGAIVGCARMGSPDGGWYDDTPPKILSTTPPDKGVNVTEKKIYIEFDEYIALEDASSKVIISPPQIEQPEIKTAGKKIVVELADTLKENTTYTIDFSDAIQDNNENNPLGNYTYSFSTGVEIDTLEVSGTVLNASNLEPVSSILVGLHSNLTDTIVTSEPFIRVSRTDSRGKFIIRGIAPGEYRIYALKDADGDYVYNQKSEMIAFSHELIKPYCGPDTKQDTIWRDSLRIDSIVRVNYTHFYPDDIVMRAFTALQTDRYLIKTERAEPDRFSFYFSYGDSIIPQIRGLNFNSDNAFVVEATEKLDTITWWIRDTLLVNNDSLTIEATYNITDTLGNLVTQTDTLDMIPKVAYEKRMKLKEKEWEDWQKEQDKKQKKGQAYDSVMPPQILDIQLQGKATSINPDQNITLVSPYPVARCDTSGIHLYSKIDSLWYKSRIEFKHKKGLLREFELRAEWRPGIEYSLEIDSAVFEDIYGHVSNSLKTGIKVKGEDEVGTLMVVVEGAPKTCDVIVQLLNSSDAIVKEAKVVDGEADFFYMAGGEYYMRALIDRNNNGIWDTGDYYVDVQPEEVFYYDKKVELKEKWDITLTWNLNSVPVDKQKPLDVTKQKPEQAKKVKNKNAERAKQLGIEYVKDNTL